MSALSANRHPRSRWLWWLTAVAGAGGTTLLVSVCAQIARDASLQQINHADAVVVFGAAEYSGRPSPVYRARLDHAYQLFREGMAPLIIASGGSGKDPKVSEG